MQKVREVKFVKSLLILSFKICLILFIILSSFLWREKPKNILLNCAYVFITLFVKIKNQLSPK